MEEIAEELKDLVDWRSVDNPEELEESIIQDLHDFFYTVTEASEAYNPPLPRSTIKERIDGLWKGQCYKIFDNWYIVPKRLVEEDKSNVES